MKTWLRRSTVGVLLLTSLMASLPALAAADAFLKLDGIKGESKAEKHVDEIEVLAWSWGAQGRGTARAFTLTKSTDTASPKLLDAALNGTRIKNASFVVRRSGERPVDFIRIKLEDVVVSTFEISAAGDRPVESVSLTFRKASFEYIPQNANGTAGNPIPMTWAEAGK
jgi:type VI secretion system secreted protein Hcp